MFDFPEGKRYNSFAGYYRQKFGERLQKLVLDAGFSCPNRDGTVGVGGCTYCDNAAFHPGYSTPGKSLLQQIDEGIEFHRERYPRVKHYLAYFQAYSNTYGPLSLLKEQYGEALSHPSVVGLVIGTRPDCIDEEKLDYLASLRCATDASERDKASADSLRFAPCTGKWSSVEALALHIPVIAIEYGIESCYDTTLQRINRGHDFECARRAVEMTAERGLDVGAHFILGLPGETREMMLEQCSIISELPLTSVKFHQLQIVKGTRMEKEYAAHPEEFLRVGLDDYLDLVIDILERLRPDLYIERVAGEVPPRFVSETPWGLIRNDGILRRLDKRLEERDTFQGRLYTTEKSLVR